MRTFPCIFPFASALALIFALIFALILACIASPAAHALGGGSVTVTAAPDVIYADGKSTTVITATVRDSGGSLAANGTSVRFTTTLGTLTPDTATTTSGVARIALTSASSAGKATITAVAFGEGAVGTPPGIAAVDFTEDRQALFSRDARWIRVDCPEYLVYSADMQILEAQGKKGSAHLSYKGLDVAADALQLDLQTQQLLAHNVRLQRGRHVLRVAELKYDLSTSAGNAVLADTAQSVTVTGFGLETAPQPLDAAQLPLTANPYRFEDLSDSRVVVSARAITAAPGDQVQFRRASIYSDGKKLLSVPYHVMPMQTDQIFGQQVLGFGSGGLFVNLPYYYNVTPRSKGTIYLRSSGAGSANLGSSLTSGVSFFGSHVGQHGMALDLEQTYEAGRGGTGQFLVSGITRSEWGAQWNHTQRIDESTTGYMFVDYPAHRSLYATSNVSRQFRGFSLNVSASGSRDPGNAGFSASSMTVNTYLQTNPRQLGSTGINYTNNFSVQRGQLIEDSPSTGRITTPISTQTLDMRFFTNPIRPDKRTQITDSLTLGQAWGGERHGFAPTVNASLGVSRSFRKSDSLSLNYTYRYDPLLSQIGTPSSGLNPLEALLRSSTQHRLTATYFTAPLPRVTVSFSGSYGLPLNDRVLFTTARYRINNDWGLGLAASYERYVTDSYQDIEYSVSRRLFGRDLLFYYSAKSKKLRFDFAGAAWQ